MTIAESFKMAFSNIRASKLRSFLTMLGIIIGVAAVILIVGLGNGMEHYITDSFASMGTNSLTVSIMGRGSSRSVSEEQMFELVEDNPDYLDRISPTVSMMGTVKIGSDTSGSTSVTGVSEDYLAIKDYESAQGRNLLYTDMVNRETVCVIGSYLSQEWFAGDALGQTLKVNGRSFTIVGVLAEEAESEEGSTDDAVFVPYSTAARLSMTGTVTSDTITVVSEDFLEEAIAVIEERLYEIFEDDDAYTVTSMAELLDSMTSMVNIVISILAAIAGISLVVGGIGIMNIMLVSVTERTREIGIRKALGAKERYIKSQFVIEAATTSAMGGMIGILVGYGLCSVGTVAATSIMEAELTVAPSTLAVLAAVGISVGIGVLFGYLPAKKAAQLNPIDALHYD